MPYYHKLNIQVPLRSVSYLTIYVERLLDFHHTCYIEQLQHLRDSCQSPSSVCNIDEALTPHPQLATFDAYRTFLTLGGPEGNLFARIHLSLIVRDIRPFMCRMCVARFLYVKGFLLQSSPVFELAIILEGEE